MVKRLDAYVESPRQRKTQERYARDPPSSMHTGSSKSIRTLDGRDDDVDSVEKLLQLLEAKGYDVSREGNSRSRRAPVSSLERRRDVTPISRSNVEQPRSQVRQKDQLRVNGPSSVPSSKLLEPYREKERLRAVPARSKMTVKSKKSKKSQLPSQPTRETKKLRLLHQRSSVPEQSRSSSLPLLPSSPLQSSQVHQQYRSSPQRSRVHHQSPSPTQRTPSPSQRTGLPKQSRSPPPRAQMPQKSPLPTLRPVPIQLKVEDNADFGDAARAVSPARNRRNRAKSPMSLRKSKTKRTSIFSRRPRRTYPVKRETHVEAPAESVKSPPLLDYVQLLPSPQKEDSVPLPPTDVAPEGTRFIINTNLWHDFVEEVKVLTGTNETRSALPPKAQSNDKWEDETVATDVRSPIMNDNQTTNGIRMTDSLQLTHGTRMTNGSQLTIDRGNGAGVTRPGSMAAPVGVGALGAAALATQTVSPRPSESATPCSPILTANTTAPWEMVKHEVESPTSQKKTDASKILQCEIKMQGYETGRPKLSNEISNGISPQRESLKSEAEPETDVSYTLISRKVSTIPPPKTGELGRKQNNFNENSPQRKLLKSEAEPEKDVSYTLISRKVSTIPPPKMGELGQIQDNSKSRDSSPLKTIRWFRSTKGPESSSDKIQAVSERALTKDTPQMEAPINLNQIDMDANGENETLTSNQSEPSNWISDAAFAVMASVAPAIYKAVTSIMSLDDDNEMSCEIDPIPKKSTPIPEKSTHIPVKSTPIPVKSTLTTRKLQTSRNDCLADASTIASKADLPNKRVRTSTIASIVNLPNKRVNPFAGLRRITRSPLKRRTIEKKVSPRSKKDLNGITTQRPVLKRNPSSSSSTKLTTPAPAVTQSAISENGAGSSNEAYWAFCTDGITGKSACDEAGAASSDTMVRSLGGAAVGISTDKPVLKKNPSFSSGSKSMTSPRAVSPCAMSENGAGLSNDGYWAFCTGGITGKSACDEAGAASSDTMVRSLGGAAVGISTDKPVLKKNPSFSSGSKSMTSPRAVSPCAMSENGAGLSNDGYWAFCTGGITGKSACDEAGAASSDTMVRSLGGAAVGISTDKPVLKKNPSFSSGSKSMTSPRAVSPCAMSENGAGLSNDGYWAFCTGGITGKSACDEAEAASSDTTVGSLGGAAVALGIATCGAFSSFQIEERDDTSQDYVIFSGRSCRCDAVIPTFRDEAVQEGSTPAPPPTANEHVEETNHTNRYFCSSNHNEFELVEGEDIQNDCCTGKTRFFSRIFNREARTKTISQRNTDESKGVIDDENTDDTILVLEPCFSDEEGNESKDFRLGNEGESASQPTIDASSFIPKTKVSTQSVLSPSKLNMPSDISTVKEDPIAQQQKKSFRIWKPHGKKDLHKTGHIVNTNKEEEEDMHQNVTLASLQDGSKELNTTPGAIKDSDQIPRADARSTDSADARNMDQGEQGAMYSEVGNSPAQSSRLCEGVLAIFAVPLACTFYNKMKASSSDNLNGSAWQDVHDKAEENTLDGTINKTVINTDDSIADDTTDNTLLDRIVGTPTDETFTDGTVEITLETTSENKILSKVISNMYSQQINSVMKNHSTVQQYDTTTKSDTELEADERSDRDYVNITTPCSPRIASAENNEENVEEALQKTVEKEATVVEETKEDYKAIKDQEDVHAKGVDRLSFWQQVTSSNTETVEKKVQLEVKKLQCSSVVACPRSPVEDTTVDAAASVEKTNESKPLSSNRRSVFVADNKEARQSSMLKASEMSTELPETTQDEAVKRVPLNETKKDFWCRVSTWNKPAENPVNKLTDTPMEKPAEKPSGKEKSFCDRPSKEAVKEDQTIASPFLSNTLWPFSSAVTDAEKDAAPDDTSTCNPKVADDTEPIGTGYFGPIATDEEDATIKATGSNSRLSIPRVSASASKAKRNTSGAISDETDNEDSVTSADLKKIKNAARVIKRYATRVGLSEKQLVEAISNAKAKDNGVMCQVGRMTDDFVVEINTTLSSFFDNRVLYSGKSSQKILR